MTRTASFRRSMTLAGGPQDVAEVRAAARLLLGGPDYDRCRDDVELAASELITNAIKHGHGQIVVTISSDGRCVRLEVTDGSSGQPRVTHASLDQEGGRGLLLVQMVSRQWGVLDTEAGKTVWAEIDLVPDQS